jgi:hypothetical protein
MEKKMNKFYLGLFCITLIFAQSRYYGSTTAPVTVAGGIIKAKHVQENVEKYKRKDCPVCKGKGWYMSGDGILKIECTYCEPEKQSITIGPIKSINPTVPAPAPPSSKNCPNGQCPISRPSYR